MRYPPDPPTVEEIIAVMCAAGNDPDGLRLRGLIVVQWRAGLRISEALALVETDLDQPRGAILVRHGKGGKRREAGMDRWAWEQLDPWLTFRATLPVGALFCVLRGPTRGRQCAPAGVRAQLRRTAQAAGVRRRFAPHQLRDAHAVEMSRGGVPLLVIPTPARACRPRHHLGVSTRDRQHRDHPSRPRTTDTHDLGHGQPHTKTLRRPRREVPELAPCDLTDKPVTRPVVPPRRRTTADVADAVASRLSCGQAKAIVGEVRGFPKAGRSQASSRCSSWR
jgi:hypothetical protein